MNIDYLQRELKLAKQVPRPFTHRNVKDRWAKASDKEAVKGLAVQFDRWDGLRGLEGF